VEDVVVTPAFWRDKSVFLTGHTGFKGGWLALWLASVGARVHGYALAPATDPNLFTTARVAEGLASHTIGDVRDAAALAGALDRAAPEVVFHLAAQPLVRASYRDPVHTYAVNVMGTVHLLEAVRRSPTVRALVNVTSDKCYENREWLWGYRESEALGGRDPYSSSKACAELVTAAYRDSFLGAGGAAIASARAGNVIGGGDWADDRLLPDFFRAARAGHALAVRYPDATRPWQHVLDPLAGYLLLAEYLAAHGQRGAQAWNFGPAEDDARPVRWLLDRLAAEMPGTGWQRTGGEQPHEAASLKLDSSKARQLLGWRPRWRLAEALRRTVEWQRGWLDGDDSRALCLAQIRAHQDTVPA
jgi:CDP-glucose 4,6-dehydratase